MFWKANLFLSPKCSTLNISQLFPLKAMSWLVDSVQQGYVQIALMTSEEKASQKMDTSHVTLASNDDDLMLTKVFSNRNQSHCYHNNRGFCSFRDKCRYQHYKQVCPNRICREPECKNRHPVLCKYKDHCKFDKRSICAFKHVPLTNDDGDMKAMVVEIKNLKDEIAKLKISVKSK